MMRKNLWIASGVAVVVVMAGLLFYGSYISAQYQMEALQTAAHEQWVQLEGAIHRWANAAPQVVAAIGPVAKQNRGPLDALKNAQQQVLQAHDPQAVMTTSRTLDEAMDGVMAIGMSDQTVRNDSKFQAVQNRLQDLRNRVAQDRERYNESLRNYNLFLGEFPNLIWAKFAGYKPDHRFFRLLERNHEGAAKPGL